MSTGAYLIPSGFADETQIFLRSMAWSQSDPDFSALHGSFPYTSHHLININGHPIDYNGFASLGNNYPSNVAENRGYLVSFFNRDGFSWTTGDIWNFDTYGAGQGSAAGLESATGLRNILADQPRGTLMLMSTLDEPENNSAPFSGELINNWFADSWTGVGFQGSYTLVSVKNVGKIYEEVATAGNGPVGFCGWIKEREYSAGLWAVDYDDYHFDTIPIGAAVDSSVSVSNALFTVLDAPSSKDVRGFFKSRRSGDYTFKLSSFDGGYFWIGDFAASGFLSGNSNIPLGGTHAVQNGYYTVNLDSNTYYPIRVLGGNNVGTGFLALEVKYENEASYYHLDGWVYHNNHMQTAFYGIDN
jgi:hypothetical protein